MPVNQQNFGTNRVNHSNKHQLTFRISALMACSFDEISSFNTAVVSFISKAFCLKIKSLLLFRPRPYIEVLGHQI
jgi:hypothetical protein